MLVITNPKRKTPAVPVTDSIEICVCPCCSGAIGRESIDRHIPEQSAFVPTRRITEAYCDHCDTLYGETHELRDGQWHPALPTAVITDPKRRQRFFRRLDKLTGTRRIVPA